MTTMPRLRDLMDADFNPFKVERLSQGTIPDPYPRIHELAAKGHVHEGSYRQLFTDQPYYGMNDFPNVMVTGYDAVQAVMTNPEVFRNHEAFLPNLGKSFGRTITTMDAPEHHRYRRIFQKAFLPQTVRKWGESVVEPVVANLLAQFAARGTADLVEEFTHHYPFQVVYAQLGLEPHQGPVFHRLAIAQLLMALGLPQGPEAVKNLGDFFDALIELKRGTPGDDLVTELINAEVDNEYLPKEVLISFFRQLLNAGGDTTYRGTSVLLVGLLNNPDQLEALRQDRSLMPKAIEEALRWEGPVTSTFRYCAQDTEVMGTKIKAGTMVNCVLASANRDPSKYEDPDRFNIFREKPVKHLAFATGPHVCIGQHLARVEMERAVNGLLDGLQNLRLDPSKPAPAIYGHILRVPEAIHVMFDPVK